MVNVHLYWHILWKSFRIFESSKILKGEKSCKIQDSASLSTTIILIIYREDDIGKDLCNYHLDFCKNFFKSQRNVK